MLKIFAGSLGAFLVAFLGVSLLESAAAFTSSSSTANAASRSLSTATELSVASESKTDGVVGVSTSTFSPTDWVRSDRKPRSKCGPCPDDDEEDDEDNDNKQMDRREAAFAMLGTLWATTSTAATLFSSPEPSHAVYGADAKIELPNMAENMANRNNKQCLVESLGNRECLVYMDPDNKLYQGVDSQKLLQKIDLSSVSLTKIPELVEAKKWSGVKSIISGQMGELLTTMNTLAPLSTQDAGRSATLAKQVKLQVFAIDAAADRKDGANILKSHQAATDALVSFVQSL
ncbi:expressed unknown protein [Seminavis robusta]|uniref:Uncharacterized protein n=1 Tax=Seminavis robusta TaxID=568900 RepID=A0A9N8HN22_9STRA|nr:expressed unknown protein [Seminavis robusta]|eukprot:Sro952_g224000.1 n/a (288) ;mRNA; r:2750-3613